MEPGTSFAHRKSTTANYTPSLTWVSESEAWPYKETATQQEKVGIDTHSLFLVRCLMAYSPIRPGEENVPSGLLRLNWFYSLSLQFVNVILQLGITYILVLAVEHDENQWESSYFKEKYGLHMSEVVAMLADVGPEDTSMVPEAIMVKCDKQTEHGLRHLSFYYLMIFVWVTKMFSEVVESVMLGVKICYVQEPEFGEENTPTFSCFDEFDGQPGQIVDAKADKSFHIILLTRKMKVFLVITVSMLRMFIALSIGYAGMKFIMLQTSYAKVILKALCMQWVITVDELLIKAFTSQATREWMGKVKIVHRKAMRAPRWQHGYGGICLFLMGCSVVLFVTTVMFGDLMALRSECLRITGRGYTRSTWDQFTHEVMEIVN